MRGANTVSAVDLQLWVTTFPGKFATTKHSEFASLRNLQQRLLDSTAPTKEQLPLLKLASFGNRRTGKGLGCLRSDRNLVPLHSDFDRLKGLVRGSAID
jgi:hypothetical protein